MPRRTKEEARKTRKAILESALNLFCENGYAKTTLSGIAKNLGMSKGAVYWHFSSKLDLIRTISKEISEKLSDALKPHADRIESMNDLTDFFVRFAEIMESDTDLKKFIKILFFKIEWDEELLDKVSFVQDKDFSNFCEQHLIKWQKKEMITDDISASTLSKVVVSNFNGCILTNLENPDFVNIVKSSTEIFFEGIMKKE